MWTRHHKQRNLGVLIVTSITALFLAYFGFHAYHGEYGLYAKYRLEARAGDLEKQLAALTEQRELLEHRVALLHDGTLEKDMLDEQARRELNLAQEDEVIIYRPVENND